ncbi:MAG: hypothetical protein MUO76_05185 [Anaerolineaceae bacterium]|nr:hypothetical protein [Anaerolineaceae bacterium]
MKWKNKYKSQIVSAQDAVRNVKSGDRLFLTSNCSVPKTLLGALVDYAPELNDVVIFQGLTVANSDYVTPEMSAHLRVNTIFSSPNVRDAVNQGLADFTPLLLSEWPLLFKRRIWPIDIAFAQVSPPDEHGFCSFGIATGIAKTPVESADFIIAEVNEQMPRMLGDTFIHVSKLDRLVPVSYPGDELLMGGYHPSREADKIAGYIADLIPDGATLQIGIGEIPGAVLKKLHGKKDLGIHSETFSDTMIELVEAGVVNGYQKTLHPGKMIAGFLLGTRSFYKWASDNPIIELHPTEYVNNPFVIAKNVRMVSINSAIEIDLTGQVCSDSIGPRIYSGVGGQMDFVYGASLSDGGMPVIAMASTAKLHNGTDVSRIVSMLKTGAGVTTSRNHVHFVVTEFGIVNLYAKSIRQRAELLISIAHPDFRDELTMEAKLLKYL